MWTMRSKTYFYCERTVTGTGRGSNHGDTILSAGLKPYSQRVRANRKRLAQ